VYFFRVLWCLGRRLGRFGGQTYGLGFEFS